MFFDNKKELNQLDSSRQASFLESRRNEKFFTFEVGGPKGSGKTKIAQDYVKSHANAFYISFGICSVATRKPRRFPHGKMTKSK